MGTSGIAAIVVVGVVVVAIVIFSIVQGVKSKKTLDKPFLSPLKAHILRYYGGYYVFATH